MRIKPHYFLLAGLLLAGCGKSPTGNGGNNNGGGNNTTKIAITNSTDMSPMLPGSQRTVSVNVTGLGSTGSCTFVPSIATTLPAGVTTGAVSQWVQDNPGQRGDGTYGGKLTMKTWMSATVESVKGKCTSSTGQVDSVVVPLAVTRPTLKFDSISPKSVSRAAGSFPQITIYGSGMLSANPTESEPGVIPCFVDLDGKVVDRPFFQTPNKTLIALAIGGEPRTTVPLCIKQGSQRFDVNLTITQ